MSGRPKSLSRIEIIADLILTEAKDRRSQNLHQNFSAAVHAIGFEVDNLLFPVMIEANRKGE
jgi:hypothetical protein